MPMLGRSSQRGGPCHLASLTWVPLVLLFLSPGVTPSSNGTSAVSVAFKGSGPAAAGSFLQYRGSVLPAFPVLTSCFRMRLDHSRHIQPLLSYAQPGNPKELLFGIELSYGTPQLVFTCCGSLTFEVGLEGLVPRLYASLCLLVDLPAHKWVLVMEGRVQTGVLSTTLRHTPRIRGAGLLYVGQKQSSNGGGFDARRSLRGTVVDLRLYNQPLTTAAMVQFTSCKLMETEVDPVIDFSNIYEEFEAGDVDIEEVTVDESYCSGYHPFDVILTPAGRFMDAAAQCHSLGGRVKVPTSESDDQALLDLMNKYESMCNAFHGSSGNSVWVGVTKDEATHTWRHYVSESPLVYSNFPPTAELTEYGNKKCVSFETKPRAKNGLWTPTSCQSRRCVACSFQIFVIRVRGLCRRSLFDSRFLVTHDSGNLSMTGLYASEIIKRPPDNSSTDDFGSWEMKRVDMEDVRATLIKKSPGHSFTGLNTWKVTNDVCGTSTVKLMLTVCKQGQFSCKDGTCVELRHRCDLQMNCPDASDEESCSRLFLPPSYDRRVPPPHAYGGPPLGLSLEVAILHIRDIDLSNFRLTIEMCTGLRWKDTRVLFKNLRLEERMNDLDEDKLWKPHVNLYGDALTSCLVEFSYSSLSAIRSTPPLPDDTERIDEDEMFSGSENLLHLQQKMTVTATCLFDLYAFPFDKQRCRITVVLSSGTSSFIHLELNQTKIYLLGQRHLRQYYLSSVTMVHMMMHNYSTQQLEVILDNLATYFITSTYVPTLIIVTIGYLTLYFPLEDFSDRIMVALTTLLVEAAFFTQTSQAIPQTSHVKLVDVWFVFCIALLFFIIVTIILLNWLYSKEQDRLTLYGASQAWVSTSRSSSRSNNSYPATKVSSFTASNLNYLSRVLIPIFSFLFVAFYVINVIKSRLSLTPASLSSSETHL